MFFTIISFYKQRKTKDPINENITLGSYLDNLKLSEYFIKFHIIPMVSLYGQCPLRGKTNAIEIFF